VATKRTNLQERYELGEVLGRGGMGVVYKAYDTLMNRHVALKTILEIDNPETIQLFYKEWSILATMVHPNIISIYDIGEFSQAGAKKPFFVMPLLPGTTLDKLIKQSSASLSAEGVVGIIGQACRGLHAAHEQGLIHRDIKPSNIFVMDDHSVKLIDFGIARGVSANSRTTLRGTVHYMAPEQFDQKPASLLSDLFSLAVVTYEALTLRKPFQGPSDYEIINAIQKLSPVPISELNHNVAYPVSQVVHKAMAKQPWSRFSSAKEFGEALEKALRNEPLAYFDSSKIKPRLERAAKSFEQGDYEFASEVLAELEAEGQLDQDVALLRSRLDQAVRLSRIQQLLQSARRFFEASEYTLALRKIQDAIDLDPNNVDALSLKEQVEKERRERKIEEWIALGRQHLENNAFRQAKEALDNVVRLKPNDTEALNLLAEVGRRELEVSNAREGKARLYEAAKQAWEKGEITSALGAVEALIAMDRELPETEAERIGTYQNFYNQVHSAHDALKNSYEEARRNLAAGNFEAALATCKQYLSQYPNHALFKALQFDVEERRRQTLSAVIAETDRRVEQEPNLDKRMGILEEAIKLYPGESHFERAVRIVRDKRDLVNSIVAKAGFFEERGQFNEALDQWQVLRSIHESQPGLAFEIERLMKRRDQQSRENAKARWVQMADKYLESGDYDRAMKTVQSALAEFPGEAELLELDKLVCKNQDLAAQARVLLDRAREYSEKGELEQSLQPLREAHDLDPRNTVVRTVLVNSLLEHARRSADSDWEAADAAVREVLSIEPTHAEAKSLASRIGDRKREELISSNLSQARRMQTAGDLAGALAIVARGLVTCPAEPRLQQLQATLERAQAEAERQAARESSRSQIPPPAPPPLTEQPGPPPLPPAMPIVPEPAGPVVSSPRSNTLVYGAVVVVAAGLALWVVGAYRRLHPKPTPSVAPAQIAKINLRASPAGAAISVDGKPCGSSACDLQLPAGSYRAEARLDGYEVAASTFQVSAGQDAPREINLTLTPTPSPSAVITVSTDLTEGSVQLDDGPAGPVQGGELELSSVPPGTHKLSFQSGAFQAVAPFEIAAGVIPKLSGPIKTSGLKGFIVARSGAEARLYSSVEGAQATLDGKPAGAIGAEGLAMKDLAPGPHEIMIDAPGGTHQKIAFDSGPANRLQASFVTNQNLGVLRVLADDGATVYLNGEKYRRATKNGRLVLYLAPKQYTIRVEKEGFATPVEQSVNLKNGEETKVEFKLLPARATLAIRNAAQGTEVWLDGNRLGMVRSDNSFSSDVAPGKHTISLKNERYKPIQSDQVFAAGKTVEMEGKLEGLLGVLKIDVNPPGKLVHVRLRREAATQDREITDTTLNLPEGTYIISGSAPQYQDSTTSVQVTANHTTTASLVLKPSKKAVATKPPEKQRGFALADWEKAGGWTREGATLIRHGGEYVLAPVPPAPGTVVFTALVRRGKRLEWVMHFHDPKNQYLFQIDDKNFTHVELLNGKRLEDVKVPHGVNRKDFISLAIVLTANSIQHRILQDRQWHVIDTWERPGAVLQGSFGLHIPGRDEIVLSDFQFSPE
jgi:serine/threonine protein kinase